MNLRPVASLVLATALVIGLGCTKPDINRSAGGSDLEEDPDNVEADDELLGDGDDVSDSGDGRDGVADEDTDHDADEQDIDAGDDPSPDQDEQPGDDDDQPADAGMDAQASTDGGSEDGSVVDDGCEAMCGPNATCSDAGCACAAGFANDDGGCHDIDECQGDMPCSVGTCRNEQGAFQCECPLGYTGTGTQACTDIDECALDNGGCGIAPCMNFDGFHECGPCPAGFVGENGACQWNDPKLEFLTVTDSEFTPSFDPIAMSYLLQTSVSTASVRITARLPAQGLGRAVIRIAGQVASHAVLSEPLPLSYGDNKIPVRVTSESGAVRIYDLVIRRGWTFRTYFKASNAGAGDGFAYRLALSSDGLTLAVGAPAEDSANPVGTAESDNSLIDSGAVYVFRRVDGSWTQEAYLKALVPGRGDAFGQALALTSDGNQLVVGAPSEDSRGTNVNSGLESDNSITNAGAAYVFERHGSTWGQTAYLKASNPGSLVASNGVRWGNAFGSEMAWSGDGSRLAVTALGEGSPAMGVGGSQTQGTGHILSGAVYMFRRSEDSWVPEAYIKSSDTHPEAWFGDGLALNGDGSLLLVGEPSTINQGGVFTYTRSEDTWIVGPVIRASNPNNGDRFGAAIALSGDASIVAIGASSEDNAASGVNPGQEGNNSASAAGAVYVFEHGDMAWTQEAYLKASNAHEFYNFGSSLALSQDGETLLVGSVSERSISMLGGSQEDSGSAGVGAAYAFRRSDSAWAQIAYIKSPRPQQAQHFAESVAMDASGSVLVVGADAETSSSAGIDGNLNGPYAQRVGAAFLFE